MTKEEIIAAIQHCAAKVGHIPSWLEFRKLTNVSKNQIRRAFGTYTAALLASGIECEGPGRVVAMRSLFLDWAGIVRRLQRIPKVIDYELHSKYSTRPLARRYGSWNNVPAGMADYARKEALEGEWEDVLTIISEQLPSKARQSGIAGVIGQPAARPKLLTNQPVYGQPLLQAPFIYAPTNEQGVLAMFGGVARDLGFSIMRVQTEFPDCEAMREVGPNLCQRVRIELEYESRNFLTHMHPLDGCELIVCWIHNWPECPLEVIELREIIGRSGDRVIGSSEKPRSH